MNNKALYYLQLAGERALHIFANLEAVDFLTQVLSLSSTLDKKPDKLQRAHWKRCLGEALYNLGKFEEAQQHLNSALALIDKPMPSGFSLRIQVYVQLLIQTAHRFRPNKYLGSKANKSTYLLEVGQILYLIHKLNFLAQKRLPTLYATFRGLNVVELAGPSHQLAMSMASAAPIFGVLGLDSTAETLVRQSLTIGQNLAKQNKYNTLARSCLPIAFFKVATGQFDLAEDILSQGVQICLKLGDTRLLEECCILLKL
jgi:tetratricopeptide (TPR) repeat protein